MYEEHPVFKAPENKDTKIWRYMDFTKFLSLIDRQALFFTRVDQLEDKFEGAPSKYTFGAEVEEKATTEQRVILKEQRERFVYLYERQRRELAVNCWHMNDYESAAMWKLYLKSNEGIAIQSTFRNLINSFYGCDDYFLWIGMINYIDYDRQGVSGDNLFQPIMHKRKSFEHERELRAVITPARTHMDSDGQHSKALSRREIPKEGVYIPTKILELIQSIYISPTCEGWFEELIKSVLQRYGIQKEVIKSSLANDPIY